MAAREIIIPVRNSELGVAVSLDALPDDEYDILQVLQAEQAPLRLWLDFAKAYLQQGREEQTRRMLEDGCSDGAGLRNERFRVGACSTHLCHSRRHRAVLRRLKVRPAVATLRVRFVLHTTGEASGFSVASRLCSR